MTGSARTSGEARQSAVDVLVHDRFPTAIRAPAAWMAELRALELTRILPHLPPAARVLDFGAGPGYQALRLSKLGYEVEAVDLGSPVPDAARPFPVKTYDGRTLPFPDATFDAVLSSNVLEHVADLSRSLAELSRVLRPGGVMLHVMPTASWRLWSSLTGFAAAPRNAWRAMSIGPTGRWGHMTRGRWNLAQAAWAVQPLLLRPHGVGGSALTELWTFSRRSWLRRFAALGYRVEHTEGLRLWYTGEALLGAGLSMPSRTHLAMWLGSATILYLVKPGAGGRRP